MAVAVQILRLVIALGMLWVPGWLLARFGTARGRTVLAYPLSIVVLFCCAFWEHAIGLKLTFGGTLAAELLVCGSLWFFGGNRIEATEKRTPARRSPEEKLLLGFAVLMVAVVLLRATLAPLQGPDTSFRWDFLARRILEFGRYDYYPPMTAGDFRTYFFVDAIPPAVSFSYWWVYAAWGSHLPALTGMLVAGQYACALALAYGIARTIATPRAGAMAAGALAATSLFFLDVAIGQETGLTALAAGGMVYVMLQRPAGWRGAIVAGACAALGAMAREYGVVLVACGAAVLLCADGKPRRRAVLTPLVAFVAAFAVLALPWFVRTACLTGNPFYSIRFLGRPVNHGHDLMMRTYGWLLTEWTAYAREWGSMALYLFVEKAMIPCTLGVIGLVALFRRRAWIPLVACGTVTVVFSALWYQSLGSTSAGRFWALRVATPAVLMLSVAAGVWLDRPHRQGTWLWVTPLLGVSMLWAFASAWAYPRQFEPDVGIVSAGLKRETPRNREDAAMTDLVQAGVPAGAKIVSSDVYLYVAALRAGYEIVPVWSPEVGFLFDATLAPAEARSRLLSLGIALVEYDEDSANGVFLDEHSPFFHYLFHNPRAYQTVIGQGNWGIIRIDR